MVWVRLMSLVSAVRSVETLLQDSTVGPMFVKHARQVKFEIL